MMKMTLTILEDIHEEYFDTQKKIVINDIDIIRRKKDPFEKNIFSGLVMELIPLVHKNF